MDDFDIVSYLMGASAGGASAPTITTVTLIDRMTDGAGFAYVKAAVENEVILSISPLENSKIMIPFMQNNNWTVKVTDFYSGEAITNTAVDFVAVFMTVNNESE